MSDATDEPESSLSDAVDVGKMPCVYEARDDFEAQCVRSVLLEAGIRSVVLSSGESIFGFPMRAGRAVVPVRVLEEDLSQAKQAISEARWTGRSVDWDEVDVGEVPPEVAQVLRRAGRERVIVRVLLVLGWLALGLVFISIGTGVVRAVLGQ